MREKVLIDSSFLYALYDESEARHKTAVDFALSNTSNITIVPNVVLTESAFLFRRKGGVPAVLGFLNSLTEAQIPLEPIIIEDVHRIREIMAAYTDAQLDFVDCCIMALSERLDITQVCTFDRRDFNVFRPQHCEYLEVLP